MKSEFVIFIVGSSELIKNLSFLNGNEFDTVKVYNHGVDRLEFINSKAAEDTLANSFVHVCSPWRRNTFQCEYHKYKWNKLLKLLATIDAQPLTIKLSDTGNIEVGQIHI